MICSHCNSYNNDNNKFCQYCGKTLLVQHDQTQQQSSYTQESLRRSTQSTHGTDQVLLGFTPLDGSAPKPLREIQSPQTTQTPQLPPQHSPIPGSAPQPYQPGQGIPARPTPPPYQPPQPVPYQQQNNHYPQKPSNKLPLIISIVAIVTLLIGIFTPVLSFKINPEGLLGMFMDSFGFSGLSEFKDISMTYSPISMMTGKPPKINAAKMIGSTMQEYLDNELNQYYSVIKNTRIEDLDPSNQVLKKSISTLQLIGVGMSLNALLLAIFVGIKLFSPNSRFSTTLVSFGGTLLLIMLIGGLIYLKTLKIDMGEIGAYFGITSFKLSEIIQTNPAFGYFSLAIGSILALTRAFNKKP